MELKLGYKQTEVGVIPEDWKIQCLGDVAHIVGGGAFKSKDVQKVGVRWLKIANVGINEILWKEEAFLPEEFSRMHSQFLLNPDDYVIALTRPILNSFLKIAKISQNDAPSLLNQRVGKIEGVNNHDPSFLYYVFQKESTVYALQQSMAGTDPPNLSTKSVYSIQCAIPSNKTEQEAITGALSDADALIESLEQLIAKKRQIKQGAMQELLTGNKRLPGFNGAWGVSTFGDIFNITAGGDVDIKETISYQDQTHCYPVYSNTVTGSGLYGYCTYSDHQACSITVSARGTLGFAIFRDHAFTAIGRVIVLHPKREIDGRFIAEVINHQITFAIESTGVPQLTAPQISNYSIPVPSFTEQTAIVCILSDMDAEINELEVKLEKVRQIKQGMMQNLLTGKIRLV